MSHLYCVMDVTRLKGVMKVAHSCQMLSYNGELRALGVGTGLPASAVCAMLRAGVGVISMTLHYGRSALPAWLSGGDGSIGEDVTTDVRTIRSGDLFVALKNLS